jgi:hypothetical protein
VHTGFATTAPAPSKNALRFVRRLLRATHDGKPLFYAAEVGGGLEHGGWGVVCAPRIEEATVEHAVEVARKSGSGHGQQPGASLALLRTDGELPVGALFGAGAGTCVNVSMACIDETPIYFAVSPGVEIAGPAELRLDEGGMGELETATARLLNLVS